MSNKVKVEILTNGKDEVLKMLKKFDVDVINVGDSGFYGCDAPSDGVDILIKPEFIKSLISELSIINQHCYFTGVNNYSSIREYI